MVKPLGALSLRSLGGYELVGQIGAGGMGQVFLGRTPGGRLLAIKVIHSGFDQDPVFRQRFSREIEAAKKVSGLYTPPVVDADPFGDPAWLATEYLPVPSLTEIVRQYGPLPEATVRVLGIGLAEALVALHKVPIVHRDLKPSNVLVAANGPRMIDFGIAHAVGDTRLTTSPIGTVGYMAPEVVRGNVGGPPADVFALGALLAFAATGRPPFEADSPQAMMALVVEGQPRLAAVPAALQSATGDCLRRKPSERPTPIQLIAALQAGAAELGSSAWLPESARRLIAARECEVAELLRTLGEPTGSLGPLVPSQGRAVVRIDNVPQGTKTAAPDPIVTPAPSAPPSTPRRSSNVWRQADRVDRREAPQRQSRPERGEFEHPVVVWITAFLAWSAVTLWLRDQGLLSASWLPHGLWWYVTLLVFPPSMTVFLVQAPSPLPVRRLKVWLAVGSWVAMGPGVVVGLLAGLIGGTTALLHAGGFWSDFLHSSVDYGAALVVGWLLAAVVAGLVTLVAKTLAVVLWVIIDIFTFGAVFGLHHGLAWGIAAAIVGVFFVGPSFEFVMDEMPGE